MLCLTLNKDFEAVDSGKVAMPTTAKRNAVVQDCGFC